MVRVLLCLLLCINICFAQDKYDTPVIANYFTDTRKISYDMLFTIFTLTEDRWYNGYPVVVVLLPLDSFPHNWFVENYLGLGKASYQRRVDNAVNSGRGEKPLIAKNNTEMLQMISTIDGAIGYLDGNILIHKDDAVIKLEVTQ